VLGSGFPVSIVDNNLVDRGRQKFDAGALPREHPKHSWRSYGTGDACNACGDPMPEGQEVLEVDIAEKTSRLHAGCDGLWEGELIRRGLFKPS
jgi:hypothetical protein